jgi:hypothetical protein
MSDTSSQKSDILKNLRHFISEARHFKSGQQQNPKKVSKCQKFFLGGQKMSGLRVGGPITIRHTWSQFYLIETLRPTLLALACSANTSQSWSHVY